MNLFCFNSIIYSSIKKASKNLNQTRPNGYVMDNDSAEMFSVPTKSVKKVVVLLFNTITKCLKI